MANGQIKKKEKKVATTFKIDCSAPAQDKIFDMASFEKFLNDRIKVSDRTGNLTNNITIKRTDGVISITAAAGVPFPKRYLKYLAKKFMKKEQVRDWLRVVSKKKDEYELRYFQIADEGNEEDEE